MPKMSQYLRRKTTKRIKITNLYLLRILRKTTKQKGKANSSKIQRTRARTKSRRTPKTKVNRSRKRRVPKIRVKENRSRRALIIKIREKTLKMTKTIKTIRKMIRMQIRKRMTKVL